MKLLIFVTALVIGANAAGNLFEEIQKLNATFLANLINQAGLVDMLSKGGPYTVLVPTDAAFAKLPDAVKAVFQADKSALIDIIKYHIIQGDVFSWDLTNRGRFTSLNGGELEVTINGKNTFFNGAQVLKHDSQASNGVIYLIDMALLVPEHSILAALQSRPELSTFLTVVKAAKLDTVLNRTTSNTITVFAPTNASFARLPQDKFDDLMATRYQLIELVDYHIHNGELHKGNLDHNSRVSTRYPGHYITIHIENGEPVLNHVGHLSEPDIETENGIVHVIDHLLIPSTLAAVIG